GVSVNEYPEIIADKGTGHGSIFDQEPPGFTPILADMREARPLIRGGHTGDPDVAIDGANDGSRIGQRNLLPRRRGILSNSDHDFLAINRSTAIKCAHPERGCHREGISGEKG